MSEAITSHCVQHERHVNRLKPSSHQRLRIVFSRRPDPLCNSPQKLQLMHDSHCGTVGAQLQVGASGSGSGAIPDKADSEAASGGRNPRHAPRRTDCAIRHCWEQNSLISSALAGNSESGRSARYRRCTVQYTFCTLSPFRVSFGGSFERI